MEKRTSEGSTTFVRDEARWGRRVTRERERERTKLFLVLVSFSLLLFFPFDAILLIYIDGGR